MLTEEENAATHVPCCEASGMKTYLLLFAMLASVAVFISGCATEPTTETTTTTHTESTRTGGY